VVDTEGGVGDRVIRRLMWTGEVLDDPRKTDSPPPLHFGPIAPYALRSRHQRPTLYSSRSERTASIAAARRAGIHAATIVIATSSTAAITNVDGSCEATPNRSDAIRRVVPSAAR